MSAQKVPYLREFNETQQAFTAEKSQNLNVQMAASTAFPTGDGSPVEELLPPWHPDVSGLSNPAAVESLKSKILALSAHKNNFLIAPPKATQLTDYSEASDGAAQACANRPVGGIRSPDSLQLAYSLLQADKNLANMRYRLVPSR